MLGRVLKHLKTVFRPESASLSAASWTEVCSPRKKQLLLEPEEVLTPETREMSFEEFYADLDAPVHRTRPVYTALLPDVRFCPTNNVITTPDRTVIRESIGPGANMFGIDADALTQAASVTPIEGVSTAFRCNFDSYYHLLVDLLSRFDLLNQPYFSRYDHIKLLCPGGLRPIEEYFVSKLCPPNVEVVSLEDGVLYRPEQYLFLSFPTRQASAYVPGPFVDRLRKRTLVDAGSPHRRIYISRRKASTRRVLNEDALMDRLRPLGFVRYDLEELAPARQIQLFQEAESVVAPHGAGLANLLFATDASVLELQSSPTVAPHFYLLCKRLDHNYSYLTHDASTIDEDFRVDPETVATTAPSLQT